MSPVRFLVAPPYGPLDEWFSHRSAKPTTAVRIRQRPHRIYFPSMLVKASVFTKHSESRFRILTFFERIKIDRKIASSTRLLITSQEGKRSKMGRAGVDDLRNEIIDFSLYRQYPIKRYKVGTNFESKK